MAHRKQWLGIFFLFYLRDNRCYNATMGIMCCWGPGSPIQDTLNDTEFIPCVKPMPTMCLRLINKLWPSRFGAW